MIRFLVDLTEPQVGRIKKYKPFVFKKRSKLRLRYVPDSSSRFLLQCSENVPSLSHLHSKERRYVKRRLMSPDEDKQPTSDRVSHHPGVMNAQDPPGGVDQNVPLIQPKTEPEEEESKWATSFPLNDLACLIYCALFSSFADSPCSLVVCAVQVKVEEVEIPITPPASPGRASPGTCQREEEGRQSRWENAEEQQASASEESANGASVV